LKKKITRFFAWLFLALFLLFFLFNSSVDVTSEDKKYLLAFLKEWKIELAKDQIHQNQENEIAYISKVQDSVLNTVCHNMVPFDSAGNVRCYFNGRKGLCFDRAFLLEKFCQLAGFRIRHLYVYFNGRGQMPTKGDFFSVGLSSHAMFEVETKDGWMAVGTNSNWIGLSENGKVMTLGDIRDKLSSNTLHFRKSFTVYMPFFETLKRKDAFRFVYGIYSRHGQFMKSAPVENMLNSIGIKSQLPDYNIRMLLANM
jgi:hypothetical protein